MRRVLLAVLVLAAFPVPASGATVTASGDDAGGVSIEDTSGEQNTLTVRAQGERVVIRERGNAPLLAGKGCTQSSARVVICDVTTDYALGIDVRLGDGDDALSLSEADS